MANIVNAAEVGLEIFNDFHPDSATQVEADYGISVPDISPDRGGMNPDISDNMSDIYEAIKKQKFKKHYQWTTTNQSFLDLHKDLKSLGVENNKFFLVLYDKTLEGIDPYAMVLPLEMQARIIKECIINPWYFLREVARVPEDGKPIVPGGGTNFRIDRNSAATWYLFLNGIDHFSSKPRQCGKTVDAIAKINYAYHFGALSATITFGNKDSTLNKMNLARLKAQRDLLPLYMQMKLSIDITTMKILKGTENITSMSNPINNNTVKLLPTAMAEAKAEGLGRGFTSSIQFWDEFEWMPFNTRIIDTSVFAYNTASDNAKKNMSLYGRIFTSTPGNLDSRDGQTADAFIRGDDTSKPMLQWKDSMFDMPINKLLEQVKSKAYNGIVFVEHGWKALKKSMEWYEKACRGVRYNAEQIAREINLMRLRGTSKSPFRRADIMALINNISQPVDSVDYSDNSCPIYFYEKLDRHTRYIMGIDPAEGLSGDNMAMVLINPYTEHIAAEFKSPYIHQGKMGRLVVNFMRKYCPKSLIVIENNRGRELIHALQESPYSNQLWYDSDKLEAKEMVNDTNESRGQRALGFNTSRTTRPLLYGILETMVAEENEKIYGKFVVDDICALEKNPVTGKIAAAQGKHDDMVMAYLIALYVFRHANNLDEWGIYRGMRPKSNQPDSPQDTVAKIKELASMLPPELRNVFMSQDKDETTEAWKYMQTVQNNRVENALNRQAINDLMGTTDDDSDDLPMELNDANLQSYWNKLETDIINLNDYDKDRDIDYFDYL